jgi:hypothetical protein
MNEGQLISALVKSECKVNSLQKEVEKLKEQLKNK